MRCSRRWPGSSQPSAHWLNFNRFDGLHDNGAELSPHVRTCESIKVSSRCCSFTHKVIKLTHPVKVSTTRTTQRSTAPRDPASSGHMSRRFGNRSRANGSPSRTDLLTCDQMQRAGLNLRARKWAEIAQPSHPQGVIFALELRTLRNFKRGHVFLHSWLPTQTDPPHPPHPPAGFLAPSVAWSAEASRLSCEEFAEILEALDFSRPTPLRVCLRGEPQLYHPTGGETFGHSGEKEEKKGKEKRERTKPGGGVFLFAAFCEKMADPLKKESFTSRGSIRHRESE